MELCLMGKPCWWDKSIPLLDIRKRRKTIVKSFLQKWLDVEKTLPFLEKDFTVVFFCCGKFVLFQSGEYSHAIIKAKGMQFVKEEAR